MRIQHTLAPTAPRWLLAALLVTLGASSLPAAALVPGTGRKLDDVGDDFEDENWSYTFNNPKSTRENDNSDRLPGGVADNGRWYEGMKRGQPDVIKRVPTPPGGLPGSTGSLLLQSLHTGIPGRPSFRMQQDDFIADVNYRLGGAIPVARGPSAVVRVFLPPVATWEKRTGPQFAFRLALETTVPKQSGGLFFSSARMESETYWPGMFIDFESKADGSDNDYAYLRIRADSRGNDFKGKAVPMTGWWTLGLSVTGDGMVHYYAKPGLENLTEKDHITSQYPYGFRGERFKTFFFNVCNGDDGKTWSTAWIIDDPTVYVAR